MVGKKILLVTNGFYPEISPRSYRATELAKEFYRQGHKVVVISKYRNYDYSDFLSEFRIEFKMWDKKQLPRIPEFRQKHLAWLSKATSRILLTLFEYPGIEDMFKVKKILRYEDNYDLMISFAVPYPVHWGVAWARSQKHKIAGTWVADCGDPYMGDVLDSFRKPFYFKYIEKWFCRETDYISVPIESAIKGYYTEFHQKIKIIPQGFDFEIGNKNVEEPSNDCPSFAYAGSFLRGSRDPQALMEFLTKLDLPFRFTVFTNQHELINNYKNSLNEKLIISDFIPRSELITILTKMDFLINYDNNTPLNSPSKLIDYALTNRPVLNITRNFNGEDLLEFLNGNYTKRMQLPEVEQYHIRNVSRLFLRLI